MTSPDPVIEYRDDQSIRITVNGRTSTVSSAHLVDERIAQLERFDWGHPVNEPHTVAETVIVECMRNIAEPNGLWHEVKEAYDHHRLFGCGPNEASFHALYEWDL